MVRRLADALSLKRGQHTGPALGRVEVIRRFKRGLGYVVSIHTCQIQPDGYRSRTRVHLVSGTEYSSGTWPALRMEGCRIGARALVQGYLQRVPVCQPGEPEQHQEQDGLCGPAIHEHDARDGNQMREHDRTLVVGRSRA